MTTRFADYEIIERIGRGGMGMVYRARDLKLGRPVALKILDPAMARDPHEMARFEQEARATSALNHPHIVQVFDFDTAEYEGREVRYLAMELVEGRSLRELLQGSAPLPEILEILAQVGDALDKAHEKGIVHRDVKPENILVTPDGYAKIVDFGIAKLTGSSELRARSIGSGKGRLAETQAGEVMGTLAYMAPEQISGGEIDGRTDVFALGNILYEAVMGDAPFRAESAHSTLRSILDDDVPKFRDPRRVAPLSLERIVRRCLAKKPAERVATTRELAEQLRAVIGEMQGNPATWVPVAQIGIRRSTIVVFVALVILVLAIAYALWRM